MNFLQCLGIKAVNSLRLQLLRQNHHNFCLVVDSFRREAPEGPGRKGISLGALRHAAAQVLNAGLLKGIRQLRLAVGIQLQVLQPLKIIDILFASLAHGLALIQQLIQRHCHLVRSRIQ